MLVVVLIGCIVGLCQNHIPKNPKKAVTEKAAKEKSAVPPVRKTITNIELTIVGWCVAEDSRGIQGALYAVESNKMNPVEYVLFFSPNVNLWQLCKQNQRLVISGYRLPDLWDIKDKPIQVQTFKLIPPTPKEASGK